MPSKREIRARVQRSRERFIRSRKAEKAFARQLKSVARQVGGIVKTMAPKGLVEKPSELTQLLRNYASILTPWARAVSSKMIVEVSQRDEHAWAEMGREIGRGLREEIRNAPTGKVMRALMDEQVELITSIPIAAAERVHRLTIEALSDGTRAAEIAKEILRTQEVSTSKAMTIARTETSRTVANLNQARSQYVGSEGYIWRTSEDSDVRTLHRELNGKYFAWNDPPVAGEKGERAHPGCIYNCRCYAESVIPDIL